MERRHISLAGALALFATPAIADLTAEDVLADHLNLLSGYGLIEMTTSDVTETDSGLSVGGFVGSYADDATSIEIRFGGIDLLERDDGSVEIVYPPVIPVNIRAEPTGEHPVDVVITFETEGLSHVASGAPDDLTHDIGLDRLWLADIQIYPEELADDLQLDVLVDLENVTTSIRLDDRGPSRRDVAFDLGMLNILVRAISPTDVSVENSDTRYQASGPGDTDLVFRLIDAAGEVSFEAGDVPRHRLDLDLGNLTWTQESVLPEDEGSIAFSMSASDMAATYDIALSIADMETSLADALRSGQGAQAAFGFASLGYSFGINSPEGDFVGKSSSGRTNGRISFDAEGFAYSGDSRDTLAEIGGPIPEFPLSTISYSVDAATFDMAMPLLTSEDAQPFRLKFTLDGLTTEEEVWSLFDPGQALPRDPLNMAFDIEGTTVVASDPFANGGAVPFRQTKATLHDLLVSVAGATLTGTGSVIDTSTGDTPSGIGELNLALSGANGLLDTLVGMGLLPEEQAMGARMMLGMFARPGDGPDTLVSRIEVKEDGTILANGQRIK